MRDVEALREHYGRTLRVGRNLETHWEAAVAGRRRGPGAGLAAVHGRVSALAFEGGKIGVNQVLVQRPGGTPPPLRRDWV